MEELWKRDMEQRYGRDMKSYIEELFKELPFGSLDRLRNACAHLDKSGFAILDTVYRRYNIGYHILYGPYVFYIINIKYIPENHINK